LEIVASFLLIVGIVGVIACGFVFLIRQFQTSILWGLGCLLIPFVSLIWLVMYWQEGKTPFLYSIMFTGIILVGVAITPA